MIFGNFTQKSKGPLYTKCSNFEKKVFASFEYKVKSIETRLKSISTSFDSNLTSINHNYFSLIFDKGVGVGHFTDSDFTDR